jgi:crotonobetainyl-CoA:carnitine CoA-transferase CaiB-like acyl-CoA transferase
MSEGVGAPTDSGPLAGIKVLDFTHGVAGPYATMILGDLGADVLKIERPERGDPTRYMNVSTRYRADIPRVGGDYFLAINRNKRAMTLDLQLDEGRGIALDLAKWSDVVVQNFRPGVMSRLKLGPTHIAAVNPRAIYASISAYGRTGPLAEQPGMDITVQARSGVMAITGHPGDDAGPIRPGASLADFSGGVHMAVAILAALVRRADTGTAEHVDVSLLDATMAMLSNYSVAVMDGGAEIGPMGSGHPQLAPYEAFRTSDGHVVIGTGTNRLFRDLCNLLGLPELVDDSRFRTNSDRVRHREVLRGLIEAATTANRTSYWIKHLEQATIPCAPVNTMAQAFAEPQLRSNDMIVEVQHPALGTMHLLGVPYKSSISKNAIRRPPPLLGEHTDSVLRTVLGVSDETIVRLRQAHVI